MTNFASASKTLVKKVVPVHSVNNFCKVCNINLLISGFGKLNIFDGVYSKEQCREFVLKNLAFKSTNSTSRYKHELGSLIWKQ